MRLFRRTRNLKRRVFRKKIGYVHLTLSGKLPVYAKQKSFLEGKIFPSPSMTLFGLYEATLRLVKDRRVKGLVVQLNNLDLGRFGNYEFLRQLLALWQKHGKKVHVYSSGYDMAEYYLASVADKIFMTRGGTLAAIGIKGEVPFLKGFLEKWGFEAQIIQVSPYKSALNNFAYDEMPEEQKEMINWMLDSVFEGLVEDIAKGRKQSIGKVREMIDSSPLTDQEAFEQGWIDAIISSAHLLDELKKDDEKAVLTEFQDAMNRILIPGRKRSQIAVIPAVGNIIDGQGKDRGLPNPFEEQYQVADISTINAIRRVRKNKKKYKAAVLFVDSPGGSATASENILNELRLLSKEMPLYAYFHSVAASGGYYISMSTKRIFAERTTVTASIGVINGKLIRKEFLEKQKIKPYVFTRGQHADIMSAERPWTEEELKIMKKQVMSIYDIFLEHVSTNRGIPRDTLEENAQGKVFIAPQALDKKLIDEILPFHDTLVKISEEVGAKSTEIDIYPPVGKPIAPMEVPDPEKINGKAMMQMYPIIQFR